MVSDLDDLKGMLFRMNREAAIPGEVKHSNPEILPLLKKDRLLDMARFYSMPVKSKMNKAELVEGLLEKMQEFEQFLRIAVILKDTEKEFLRSLISKDTRDMNELHTGIIIRDNFVPPSAYEFLMKIGLVFSFIQEDKISFVCTDEAIEAYPVLFAPASDDIRRRYQYIHSYLLAMTNLYGVFPLSQFSSVFMMQNQGFGMPENELLSVLFVLCSREDEYETDGRQVFSTIYNSELADPDELDDLQMRVQGKPFYVPPKEEFLKYQDDFYYPPTAELEALHSFLLKEICPDEVMAEELADDIKLLCREEATLDEIMREFERRSLVFRDDKQIADLAAYIAAVSNTSRMISNRGYTPLELMNVYKKPTKTRAKITSIFPG